MLVQMHTTTWAKWVFFRFFFSDTNECSPSDQEQVHLTWYQGFVLFQKQQYYVTIEIEITDPLWKYSFSRLPSFLHNVVEKW